MARPPLFTDDQILARARTVFVERGYSARTKQLAAAVGLTWPAIANRFGSKRALFTLSMAARGEPACARAGTADLHGLLEGVDAHLWECWPARLQVRLAPNASSPDEQPQALAQRLADALQAQTRCGRIRSDLSAEVLARLVLALLTGHVAQRFVAGERTPQADRGFIDTVVRLLRPQPGAALS